MASGRYYNRRATIFVNPPIVMGQKDVSTLNPIFDEYGFMASLSEEMGFKVVDNKLVPQQVLAVEYRKLEQSMIVKFANNRIDLIQELKAKDVEMMENELFVNLAQEIFGKVVEKYGRTVTRLALGGKLCYFASVEVMDRVYEKMTSAEENPIEWRLKKVLRENFNSMIINKVFTIARDRVRNFDNENEECLAVEIDINTLMSAKDNFTKDDQGSFWEHALKIQKSAEVFYNDLVSNE